MQSRSDFGRGRVANRQIHFAVRQCKSESSVGGENRAAQLFVQRVLTLGRGAMDSMEKLTGTLTFGTKITAECEILHEQYFAGHSGTASCVLSVAASTLRQRLPISGGSVNF